MAIHPPQACLTNPLGATDRPETSENSDTSSGLASANGATTSRGDMTIKGNNAASRAAATTTPSVPHGFKWTPQDVFCSSLFGPWDDLPTRNYHGNTPLLRDLDRIISLFDARIQHSDAGFRAWRTRHKQAMESGLADIPGFPALRAKQRKGGAHAWQDDAWEQRYHYLICQRHRMILARLDSRFMLSRRDRDAFFGKMPAPQRETLKGRPPKGLHSHHIVLREDWYMPLDFLLERAAREWNMDTAEVKSQFWRDEARLAATTGLRGTMDQDDAVMVDVDDTPANGGSGIEKGCGKEVEKGKGKGKGKGKEHRCGKMDLAYLLQDPSQLVQGSRVPHVSVEGQMSW